jgi:hypothetical protein
MMFCEHAGVITESPTIGTHWQLSERPMANDRVRSKHGVRLLTDQVVSRQKRPFIGRGKRLLLGSMSTLDQTADHFELCVLECSDTLECVRSVDGKVGKHAAGLREMLRVGL